MMDIDTRALMADAKFYEGYSRWDDALNRYETWDESVTRVMNMHREFYKDKMTDELALLIDEAEDLYKQKYVLGAQRALQFGGEQILKHHLRMYNCLSSYADRPAFFGEMFYALLCGAGVGFSVQSHHIAKLPAIMPRKGHAKIHEVDDSIEGWATALDVLMSSFFSGGKHPEYEGRRVYFELTKIRPKGALISGGFKAPGPEPLRKALDKIEHLIQGAILAGRTQLKSLEVYDICMYASDAVLAGGVRRSATICLFSPTDTDMITAKTGNWYIDNPQRGRSNNSAVIVRKTADREHFSTLMQSIKEFGEPGFIFTESTEHTVNPCVTGDTLVTVKDHDVIENEVLIAEGVTYQVPVAHLVDQYTTFKQHGGHITQLPLALSKNLETNELEFKQIVWAEKTRQEASLVKVTCEITGKSLTCTPDHKIWTTNRGWVEAQHLSDDDILDIQ